MQINQYLSDVVTFTEVQVLFTVRDSTMFLLRGKKASVTAKKKKTEKKLNRNRKKFCV